MLRELSEEIYAIIFLILGLSCLIFIYPLSYFESWIFGLDNIKLIIFKQGAFFVLGMISLLFGLISFIRLDRFKNYFYKKNKKLEAKE